MPGLTPVTGGGAFTRQNIAQINANFAAISQPDLWVRPQNGNDANPGTYESPLATFSGTSKYLKPGMVIGLLGTAFECWAPPAVNDITIVGMANQPRQATDSGIPNGGGSTWLNATHTGTPTASPLLKIGGAETELKVSQGWTLRNIYMNNNATGSTTSCVELMRGDGAGTDVGRDASHFAAYGCKFTGANFGIRDSGGASFVRLEDCEFFNFAGAGDTAIKEGTDTDVALPLQWVVLNNRFWNNTVHMTVPLSSAVIQGNSFGYIGSSITTTTQMTLTSGKNNSIHGNFFEVPYSTNGITAMFALGTNDRFFLNSFGSAVTTTIFGFGSPSS